ncbi:MAG: NAD(P)-binding protein, partial [Alphaproteobacteria bacterium]|nr:NAD(P)-binding protein [Alphaproteobacteria bacterium]
MAESEGEQGGGNGGGGRFSLFLRELKRSLGLGPDPNAELSEDLAEALEERREAQLPFEPQERRMLMNIIRFGELKVDDVMVPRADIIAIEAATPLPEVIEAVREAIGEGILTLRLSGDEMLEGGLSAADCIAIARHLSAPGRLDALNVLGGNAVSEVGIARNIPGMGTPTAPFLKMAAGIRAATGMPVFHATRITDVETARHAIANGMIDMVSMTRGHIADPDIVAKLQDGAVDRIRPCVGARYCLDGAVYGGGIACIHNPATGREKTIPQRIAPTDGPKRRVVVVGGGPAGLEAARVSALRGHRVQLFEAAEKLGGQVLVAARAQGRAELGEVTGWLSREVHAAGVAVELGAFAEPAAIAALGADIV